jgi:AmiR/NasT family two-component response regulator
MTGRILIADDESLIRMDLREMLTALGYEVVGEAADGREAVRLARATKPDLVVMDIKMPPGTDGVTAAKELLEDAVAPVLFLTAYSERELVEGATEAGAVGYLVKPFRESDLRPAIEVAMARAADLRRLEAETTKLRADLETRKVLDRAKGIIMTRYSCTENDAYHRIQKMAMNSRKSMRDVCEAIILASDV